MSNRTGPDSLGGMSWEAARNVMTKLRAELYAEGARRNSEVIALNTMLACFPMILAERDALKKREQELVEYLEAEAEHEVECAQEFTDFARQLRGLEITARRLIRERDEALAARSSK